MGIENTAGLTLNVMDHGVAGDQVRRVRVSCVCADGPCTNWDRSRSGRSFAFGG